MLLRKLLTIGCVALTALSATKLPAEGRADVSTNSLQIWSWSNLVAWEVAPYESKKRISEERYTLLQSAATLSSSIGM